MGKRDLLTWIKELNAEITALKGEISKREDIIKKLKELESLPSVGVKVKRGPGRPPGSGNRKRGRKPGRPRTSTAKRPIRRKYEKPVGDMILDILRTMKQPAPLEDLTQKVHKKHPRLGGVKYRAIVSSIVSRDPKFKRIGKDKITYK